MISSLKEVVLSDKERHFVVFVLASRWLWLWNGSQSVILLQDDELHYHAFAKSANVILAVRDQELKTGRLTGGAHRCNNLISEHLLSCLICCSCITLCASIDTILFCIERNLDDLGR
jgi:hypothetical protein